MNSNETRIDENIVNNNNGQDSFISFDNNSKFNSIQHENVKFSVRVSDLNDIMQLKSDEALKKMNSNLGGIDLLAYKLDTNLQAGINENPDELEKRIKLYGKNEIPLKPPKSIFLLAFEAVKDITLIMLIICAIISFGLSFYNPEYERDEEYRDVYEDSANLEWVEGIAILVAVIVVVVVTAFNDWSKEKQFRKLQDRIENENLTHVIRNGQMKEIPAKKLLVGDICCIKYGDTIHADGILVQSNDLIVDESSLTGETDMVKKNTTENFMMLSGTHVMEGRGQFLVLAVGLNSQTGIIMTLLGCANVEKKKIETKNREKMTKEEAELEELRLQKEKKLIENYEKMHPNKNNSVLQNKISKIALQIGYAGISAALLTFIILCLNMAIKEFAIDKNEWSNIYVKYMMSYLIQAITVIVVAVPEGLPLAVTLSLAFAVQRMTKDNNLVRHLDACETMGNATTICSDKTGTLTTNRMTAVQCWLGGELYLRIPDQARVNNQLKEILFESISVNTSYTSQLERAKKLGEFPKQIGNKTECGLLGLVNDLGGNYNKIRLSYPAEQFVKVYTFNSARKMMSTIIKLNDEKNCFRVHTKGASELVLSKCRYYLNANNEPVEFTSDNKETIIKKIIEPMALDGLRTICIAYKEYRINSNDESNKKNIELVTDTPDWDDESKIFDNLTCLAIVGIEDPVRDEVPDAIKKCQKSGVVVRMVTGDNINTATSIAIKCGIVKPSDDYLILESKEFNNKIRDSNGEVDQNLFDQVWPRLRVLARSTPQDKYILVNGIVESKLNPNREVVAVTGDGTNDGPALKRADVGFAMGIQGTDVAKEASDIILTDDNFNSIVKAVMWGRNVYDSIAKFLQFQLTANLSAALFSIICAATIQAVPLKALQMLWVNMVMDTLASLALATEPASEELLKRKPYGRNKSIISPTMGKKILGHSIYQLSILFGLVWGIQDWMKVDSIIKYDDIEKLKEPSLHFTIIFNAFVLMTLFNEINARKIHNERNVFEGIHKNWIFIVIWLFCFILQIIIVNFGGIVFACVPISLDHWIWCLFLGVGSLLWEQVVITIPSSIFKICSIKEDETSENLEMDKVDNINDENIKIEIEANKKYIEENKWLDLSHRVQHEINVVNEFEDEIKKSSY